jgi:tetratricopeptide (TPR) repeat protein
MKTLLQILVILAAGLCLPATIHGQSEEKLTKDKQAFDEAYKFYEDGDLENALVTFYEFMRVYPESHLVARAHFNIGCVSRELKRVEGAKAAFLEILDKEYDEMDPNSLMEPYALYKHHSCRHLAEIFLEEKNYKEAEKYIQHFDKVYPYQHFCGNEWAAYDIYKATMEARVLEGKQKHERAIAVLLPEIFENGLASNDYLLDELIGILNRHFTNDEIQGELRNALSSLKVESKKRGDVATIKLYGHDIVVNEYYFAEENIGLITRADKYRALVLSNKLFKTFIAEP